MAKENRASWSYFLYRFKALSIVVKLQQAGLLGLVSWICRVIRFWLMGYPYYNNINKIVKQVYGNWVVQMGCFCTRSVKHRKPVWNSTSSQWTKFNIPVLSWRSLESTALHPGYYYNSIQSSVFNWNEANPANKGEDCGGRFIVIKALELHQRPVHPQGKHYLQWGPSMHYNNKN